MTLEANLMKDNDWDELIASMSFERQYKASTSIQWSFSYHGCLFAIYSNTSPGYFDVSIKDTSIGMWIYDVSKLTIESAFQTLILRSVHES